MADFTALTLQLGIITQLQSANRLRVGSGVTSSAGNLLLDAVGPDIRLAAGKVLSLAVGAGAVDFSSGTGIFKTPSGFVTIGPGAVTVSGVASFTAVGTALSVINNAHIGGDFSVDGATTVTGELFADGGIDRSSAGVLDIGGATATTVFLGRVGELTHVRGDLRVDGAETVLGGSIFEDNATLKGDVTLGDASSDQLTVNATTTLNASLTAASGASISTSGAGSINLPNRPAARFQIEGVSVSANVTSSNLGALTAGPSSSADALHTHEGLVSPLDHAALRQLIHFINEGPAETFASGAYKETTGGVFPSAEYWYTDNTKAQKIVTLDTVRDTTQLPIIETWKVYDTDGSTVLATVEDTIVYSGVFEISRTRSIS